MTSYLDYPKPGDVVTVQHKMYNGIWSRKCKILEYENMFGYCFCQENPKQEFNLSRVLRVHHIENVPLYMTEISKSSRTWFENVGIEMDSLFVDVSLDCISKSDLPTRLRKNTRNKFKCIYGDQLIRRSFVIRNIVYVEITRQALDIAQRNQYNEDIQIFNTGDRFELRCRKFVGYDVLDNVLQEMRDFLSDFGGDLNVIRIKSGFQDLRYNLPNSLQSTLDTRITVDRRNLTNF